MTTKMADRAELLKDYHSRLIVLERLAPLSAETYLTEIRQFLPWLEEAGLDFAGVKPGDLSAYLEHRRCEDGIDSSSAAKAISALRSFYKFVVDEKYREDNPAAVLEIPKRKGRLPQVLGREDVERVLSGTDLSTPTGIRDRALFEFIYSAGLRVSEAVALNLGDVSMLERIVRLHGKGRKERLAPFGEEAAQRLQAYLTEGRPKLLGAKRSSAFFIGRNGKRLSRKGIWKNYSRLAALAGTGSKIHTLRHSFATELLAGGADLRSVQELLGHADLATTQIYTHLDVSRLREQHSRYMPRLKEYINEG